MSAAGSPYRSPAEPAPRARRPRAPSALGTLVTEYRARRPGPAVLGAVLAVIAIAAALRLAGAITLEAALIGGALGAALVVPTWPRRNLVELHERGLVLAPGAGAIAIPFAEIAELFVWAPRGLGVRDGLRVGITTRDGIRHDLDVRHIELLAALAWRLDRECSQPRLAPTRAALERGETVGFGMLRFDRRALRAGAIEAAWSDVASVFVGADRVEIRRRDAEPVVLARGEIAHPSVLRALLPSLAHVELEGPGTALGL